MSINDQFQMFLLLSFKTKLEKIKYLQKYLNDNFQPTIVYSIYNLTRTLKIESFEQTNSTELATQTTLAYLHSLIPNVYSELLPFVMYLIDLEDNLDI